LFSSPSSKFFRQSLTTNHWSLARHAAVPRRLSESEFEHGTDRLKLRAMSSETQDLVRICEALPQNKRTEVTDFARFLLAQQNNERWEQLLNDPRPRPKLETFLRESAAEGESPIDPSRL